MVFAIWGAILTSLLFFAATGDVLLTLGLFLLAHLGFVGANVYDAFLPDLTTDDTIDMVSSRGFAWGYLGGGLHLLLSGIDPVQRRCDPDRHRLGHQDRHRLGRDLVARIRSGVQGNATGRRVSELPGGVVPSWWAYTRFGFSRTLHVAKVAHNRPLLVFIIAFMLFNDGVQTTIALAAVYATETLDLGITIVIVGVLLVQFIAFFGAIGFGVWRIESGPSALLPASRFGRR